jgi:hypothetical protein
LVCFQQERFPPFSSKQLLKTAKTAAQKQQAAAAAKMEAAVSLLER